MSTPKIRMVYVAGKFNGRTQLERREHVTEAVRCAAWLIHCLGDLGAYPVVPHGTGEHLYGIGEEPLHYAGTLELMRRCDAVIMVPDWQKSKGAVAEFEEAKRLGLPVFHAYNAESNTAMREWLKG